MTKYRTKVTGSIAVSIKKKPKKNHMPESVTIRHSTNQAVTKNFMR